MFDIQHYASFVAAILLFQLAPGPGTLAILGATARDGVRGGMGAVLGTLTGDFLYMAAAVLGLAAVLAAYPVAFAALRWFGIAYLLWVAWGLLRAPAEGKQAGREAPAGGWIHYRRALAVSMTNPKVIMFFMAFFPLFLKADSGAATLAVMMGHVTLLSLVYQTLLVLAGNAVARRLSRHPALGTLARRLAGLALVGFGLRLALDRR